MLFKSLVILAAASSVLAAPLMERQSNASTCTDPDLRRAWHTLKDSEKKAYIDAELCLMSKPAAHGLRGARTLFDEMQSVHVLQSEIAHWVGQFFPFHRLYLRAHEYLLQTECGYEGAHPYWAEHLDAGAFSNATIFSAENGFGGNGVGDLLCVEDGPFANYTNPLGPGYKVSDHCIERRFADRVSRGSSAAVVEACMAKTNFLEFWNCVEMTSHGAGHGGVGAQMTNPISSPGDPIFYMHHAWLDRIWAKWQEEDPSVRMTEMGGNNRPRLGMAMPGAGGNPFGSGPPTPGLGSMEDMIRPDDVPAPAIIGDPGNVTTLNHLITMYGILPNRTISEVMNTKGSYLCYEYD